MTLVIKNVNGKNNEMSKRYVMKIIFAFVTILCSMLVVRAQNLSFINYNEAPVMYNPAMLASINRAQVTLTYRNSKLTTDVNNVSALLGLQMPLGVYTKKLNLGTFCISAFDDHSNYAPSIKKTGVAFAYSQPVELTPRSFLSIGLQCNVYEKRLNINNFTTGSQWNNNLGFDPSLANNEEQFNNRFNQFSFNSGLYWQLNGNNNRTKAFAGASLYNINRPNESFVGNENKQPWRYLLHGGYTIGENYLGNIMADALWLSQEKQKVAGLGLKAGMYYGSSTSGIGEIAVNTRFFSNNTLMIGVSLEQNWFALGISYDFLTIQSVSSDYHSNAMEIFLKVRFGRTKKRQPSSLPVAANNYVAGQKRLFAEERKTEVVESFTNDSLALKKAETVSDTTNIKYKPIKLALKRDFKFAFNDAVLNDEAKAYLDELTALMKRNKNVTLEIIGHTDDVGSKDDNLKISVRRARIVADYLEKNGIDKKRLTVTGKMDSEPLLPNTSPDNRSKNRRVEFILLN